MWSISTHYLCKVQAQYMAATWWLTVDVDTNVWDEITYPFILEWISDFTHTLPGMYLLFHARI